MSDLLVPLLRAIASLSVTLGLIVLLGWVWKRYGSAFNQPLAPKQHRLKVLESKRLNQHTTLHLVQDDTTEHLLATSASGTSVIRSSPLKPTSKKTQ